MRWTDVEVLGREGLIAAWVEVNGTPPPKKMSQGFMRSILAYDLQAREYGGLKPGALKRIKNAGREGPRSTNRDRGALKPGGRLIRDWNGVSHIVEVTDEGFVWQGQTHRSLSAIARAITGTRWSGPRFFGL
jgi:hypothetical protein